LIAEWQSGASRAVKRLNILHNAVRPVGSAARHRRSISASSRPDLPQESE